MEKQSLSLLLLFAVFLLIIVVEVQFNGVDAQTIDCRNVNNAVRIKNDNDEAYYDIVKNELELQCLVQKKIAYKIISPDMQPLVSNSFKFASTLTTYIQTLLGLDPSSPSSQMKYSFYPAKRNLVCNTHASGPYVQSGGGSQLCELVLNEAGKLDKLLFLLKSIIDLGSTPALTKDEIKKQAEIIKAATLDVGYSQSAQFPLSYNSSNCIYNPNKDKSGKFICTNIDDMPKDYYGISGGGGGGGGGMTSPIFNPLSLLKVGGGGGGGIQIGSGVPIVSGGFGSTDRSDVKLNPLSDPSKFANTFREKIIPAIKKCEANPETFVLVLGGGGGAGWETFLPYDKKQTNTFPILIQRQGGYGFGYGFQFAFGDDKQVVLNSDSDIGSIPMAVCPFGGDGDNWKKCLQAKSTSLTATPKPINGTRVSTVSRCASNYASAICGAATYKDRKTKEEIPYGAFTNYESCNCPVSNMYSEHFLPNTPQYKFLRTVRCSYSKTPPLAPMITADDIKRQADKVCPALDDCMMFEPCKDAKPIDLRVYVSSEIAIPFKIIEVVEGDIQFKAQELVCSLLQRTLKQRLSELADVDTDGICEDFLIDNSPNACEDFKVDQKSCALLRVSEEFFAQKNNYEKVMNVSNRVLVYSAFTAGLNVAMRNELKFKVLGIQAQSETTTLFGQPLGSLETPFTNVASCASLSLNTKCDCESSSNEYCSFNSKKKKCEDLSNGLTPQSKNPESCDPYPSSGKCNSVTNINTCKGYFGCDWISNKCNNSTITA